MPPSDSRESPPWDDSLGVVIPALNEDEALAHLLGDLARLDTRHPIQIVVVDGGSSDATVEVARAHGASILVSPPGRGRQMRAGAAYLAMEAHAAPPNPGPRWLLFLHADSRLPPPAREALARALRPPRPDAAFHFTFRLDGPEWRWRVLEWGQRLRQRLTGLAYGDQGLLVRRTHLDASGGVPDLPIMEDVALVRALRRTGTLQELGAPLVTSSRRYREEGVVRGWLRNAALISLFGMGMPARKLARWYRPRTHPPHPPSSHRKLLVFAKAPRPGKVKTRLAQSIGAERAAAIYRRLGHDVVQSLSGGPWQTVVTFAPAHAEDELRQWLPFDGLLFSPQVEGDLGTRMHRAIQDAMTAPDTPGSTARPAVRPVVVVGTDAPDVNAPLVEAAFRALEPPSASPGHPPAADVVLGPARDGGYYLIGVRSPQPTLFQNMEWSTPTVRAETLQRAEAARLRVVELEPLSDVDVVEDLPPEFGEG